MASVDPSKKPFRLSLPVHLSLWVGLVSFAVYIMTLSPGVSWAHHSEDSGDLITACWTLGIPHPTGYPLFCMTGWIWSHVVAIGTVAWRMNLFSAFWGALAAALTVRAVWAGFSLLEVNIQSRLTSFLKAVASVSSGLLLAFATDVWKLSVVTEVYSLNLFFTALIGWILIELLIIAKNIDEGKNSGELGRRRGRLILWLGLSWGLAMANHLTSLFLLPGILVVWIFGKVHPKPKEIGTGLLWLSIGLLTYLYLPIRSSMNPPLDWGNPETAENFLWVVSGRQFRMLMYSMLPFQMLNQIMRYSSIPGELGSIGALAAMLGLIKLLLARNRGIVILLVYTMLITASSLYSLANYAIWDPEGYLLPMIWASAIWAGWGIVFLVDAPRKLVPIGKFIAVLILISAPIFGLTGHWHEVDLSGNREAIQFGEESFESFEENAVVLEVRYERAFTLWYYREIEYADTRDDVAVIFVEHAGFDWGLDLLRRKYPDLVLPDEVIVAPDKDADIAAWIIENNIENRPIYIGAIVKSLSDKGYTFNAVGLMYRVYPPMEIESLSF